MSTKFTIQELFEAGVHFGHKKNLWNPQMVEYIYGVRHGIHIIDLQQTYVLLNSALKLLKTVAGKNGKILFIGTKRQASDSIAEAALRCGQHYVNYRWPGGMLTNWSTISQSIKTLEHYEKQLIDEESILTKKENLYLQRKKDKLERVLGGIRNMNGVPDIIFVIDTNEQKTAIKEAHKLGIPVIAIVDTNSKLESISHPIPGNDDSSNAIKLYCRLASDAILEGIQYSLAREGIDIGSLENVQDIESKSDLEQKKQ